MGIFLILLSITLVIFLVFKGVPVFYSAVLASMFCLLTAALFTGAGADTGMVNYLINGMTGAEGSYVSGLGGYFTKNFCIFVLGAIFGKLFDNSGDPVSGLGSDLWRRFCICSILCNVSADAVSV